MTSPHTLFLLDVILSYKSWKIVYTQDYAKNHHNIFRQVSSLFILREESALVVNSKIYSYLNDRKYLETI